MRALVIEDDPSVSRSIELILKTRGHSCAVAGSGAAGLELALKDSYDIILLDLSLPDLDGHSVLQKLHAAHVRTPVLILSGSNDREDKVKGLGIGADDYVTKPFDKDELLARIRAIIRRATGRTPPAKAAVLDGTLLAKRGQATAWEFTESYAPPGTQPAARSRAPDPPGDEGPPSGATPARRIEFGVLTPARAPEPSPETSPEAPPDTHNAPETVPDLGPARIVVLGNAKGGTGKSTIAMHLIVALLNAGRSVGSLDCDQPQGSLSRYIGYRRRFAEKSTPGLALPSHACLSAGALSDGQADLALGALCRDHEVVVIDTPGYDTPLARWAHKRADVLITPINDSFLDLEVLAETAEDAEDAKDARAEIGGGHYGDLVKAARACRKASGRGGIEWMVLRNRLAHVDARNRQRMAKALARLSASLDFREGPGLRERVIYRELFQSGLTLLDLPRADTPVKFGMSHVTARQEVRRLLETVLSACTRKARAETGSEAGDAPAERAVSSAVSPAVSS